MNRGCSTMIETKWQSAEWHTKSSPCPKKAHEQIQGENYDYCFFQQLWHCAQRIYTSRTVKHAFYKDVLE